MTENEEDMNESNAKDANTTSDSFMMAGGEVGKTKKI